MSQTQNAEPAYPEIITGLAGSLLSGSQYRYYLYHNADCICPAAEKKKAAAGQSFLMPKYEYHGGFDFQSRQFFYFWRLIGGSRLDCRPLP